MDHAARAMIDAFAVHGGRIDQARAAFPQVLMWTDLSTGIAPWSYPFDAIARTVERLPDPASLKALEATAATVFGAAPDRVVAVPGSDLALRLLGVILPGTPAVVEPGYSGHRTMWAERAVTSCSQDALLAAAGTHDALVLARPNNPDGWVADRTQLRDAAAMLWARKGYLIVDEAFADAAPHHSLAPNDWPGLIVLRSFGKFYGLAGLRLGFVIAPPPVCDRLRALIGDWPVSGPAIAAGQAAYADREWQATQRERLISASWTLTELLVAHGVPIIGSTPFFTLVTSPWRDALFVHLADAGLLTRPFIDAPDRLRIGLPQSESDWTRLDAALAAWRLQ